MGMTTQNDVTNALTSAMQTIAESNAQSKEATLTIEAEIVEVVDEGLGTYIVKYLGNKFEATTAHTEISYSVGDIVYVIIPNGNFDRNKVILSPVNPTTATYTSTQNDISYITIGDNLFKSIDDVSLCTYRPQPIPNVNPNDYFSYTNVTVDTTGFESLFKASLTESRVFKLSCKIQTNIEKERRINGNYGLILCLPIQYINSSYYASSSRIFTYTIDINNIIGDAYNLSVPSLQNFYFSLPEGAIYYGGYDRNPGFIAFVDNFIGEDNTKPDDIFITDIQLSPALELDKNEMSGYKSIITATGGNSFLSNVTDDSKILSINLYLNGKNTKVNDFECYWFRENSLITSNSEKYLSFGGIGWEVLNKVSEKSISEDGKVTNIYKTNEYTYIVQQSEIHYDTRFKCVLLKGEQIVSTITNIKNLASDTIIKLTSVSGSTVFPIGSGNVELQLECSNDAIFYDSNSNIGYSWQRFDKNGKYIDNDFYEIYEYNESNITKISFPVYIIDELNRISCTVYADTPSLDGNSVKRQIIGTVSIVLSTTEKFSGAYITVLNGDKLYKYDLDGDSPMVAEYDGPRSSAITSIDPIMVNLYREDGGEFTANEYDVVEIQYLVPINSMIKLSSSYYDSYTNPGYYTIYRTGCSNEENRKLEYSIVNTYNKNKNDNTIIIKVYNLIPTDYGSIEAAEEPIAYTTANIRFIKEGESGTNGSKYTAVLTCRDNSNDRNFYAYGEKDVNGKIHKFKLLYSSNLNNWFSNWANDSVSSGKDFTSQFSPVLYSDGQPISLSLSDYEYEIFDVSSYDEQENLISPLKIAPVDKIVLDTLKWDDNTENFGAILQVKIKIPSSYGSTSITSSEEYIYAYYPIECIWTDSYPNSGIRYIKGIWPDIRGGFSEVMYASDGTNPKFDNDDHFYISWDDIISDYFYIDVNRRYYNYTIDMSSNLQLKTKDGSQIISPKAKYDNGEAKNYIIVDIDRDSNQVNRLQTKIDNLISEKDSQENRMNCYQDIIYNFSNSIDEWDSLYQYSINKLTQASTFYLTKTNLIKTIEQLLEQINRLYFLCNQYKEIDDNTDEKVIIIYNEILEKITLLNNLKNLCIELGTSEGIIEQIKAITLSSLAITNKIQYEEIPERSCYFTINDNIDIYNNIINNVYSSYLEELDNAEVISGDSIVKEIVDEISDTLNNNYWNGLIDTTYGYEFYYKFNGLLETLKSRINSVSTQIDIYSYNSIIEDVLKPMNDSISFYYGYYDILLNKLGEISNQYYDLEDEINNLELLLLGEENFHMKVVKPIPMYYNRYEMSFLNGWDGNKLDLGDGYLIAPQVGAGIKNNNNTFTGIVMGVKQIKETSSENQQIGLFGYSAGAQSIFLNAWDGSATFGVSGKGQVIIDPSENKAIIKSGNYTPSTASTVGEGMLIDLTTPEIKFGSGKFEVNSQGEITAKGGGQIANWYINNTELCAMKWTSGGTFTKVLTLDSENARIYSGMHSSLDDHTHTGFCLQGDFSNSSGSIAGLSIGSKFYADADGVVRIGVGAVQGTSENYWTINGSGTTSYIAFGTQTFNSGARSVYLGTDGLSLGSDKFYVSNSGVLYSKSGYIGGWSISPNALSSTDVSSGNTITISSEGNIRQINSDGTNNWSINRSGNAIFKNIYCDNLFTFKSSGNNTEFTNTSFKGSGNATYGSTTTDPFSGQCVNHIKTLSVDAFEAKYISAGKIDAQYIDADQITTDVINSFQSSSEITFGGDIHADSITIGAGGPGISNRFTHPATINIFDSTGAYTGQITVLATD